MIVVTTQPDSNYYLWQLKLQMFNLSRFGISADQIYCVTSYDKEPNPNYTELESLCHLLRFKDERVDKRYTASIKPYLMGKFLDEVRPDDYILYIDNDVLMLDDINFASLESGPNWYGSEVGSYLSYDYITSKGVAPLLDMCAVAGINPNLVRQHQSICGGCHYYFKANEPEFWETVEVVGNAMYHKTVSKRKAYREDWLRISRQYDRSDIHTPLQEWTAEMWATMWEVYKEGKSILPTPELEFCFRDTPLEYTTKAKLLHYTGVEDSRFFMKEEFNTGRTGKEARAVDPFSYDLSYVSPDFASYYVVKEIRDYKEHYGI